MAEKAVFTIGYEGKTIDEFIGQLQKAGVKRVVDVRRITSSRKRDFSKTRLSQNLERKGIEYVGARELGTPDEIRRAYKAGGPIEEFRKRYERYIDSVPEATMRLELLAREKPTVIMCFENDVEKCHRLILAKRLEKKGFGVGNL